MSTGADVMVCRAESYDYPLIRKQISRIGDELLGGWNLFIPKGATVLIKPNFLIPAQSMDAVTTHPALIRAVCEVCREAGAGKVMVGDSPAVGNAVKVAQKSGLAAALKDTGATVENFTQTAPVFPPDGFLHRQFTIARQAVDADIIINMPKFKTHAMMTLTLAVKNLYGLFIGAQKARWHFQSGKDYHHFARLLVELAYTVKPSLSILDAVVGMEGNGPSRGTPRSLGFILASRDMLSLDRVAVEIAGIPPQTVYTLEAGKKMGFDVSLEHIHLSGDDIHPLKIDDLSLAAPMQVEGPAVLRPILWLFRDHLTTRPFVDNQICKGCALCLKACPADAMIQKEPGKPVKINYSNCIRCCCCQEVCPEGAVTVRDAIGVRILKRLGLG